MSTVAIVLIASFATVTIAFLGIGIKVVLSHNGEFKRHCSHIDPYTGKKEGCACSLANSMCDKQKRHPYQPLEVNQELMKEIDSTRQ